MSMVNAAKNNSKLTDFDDLKDVVIDHISKVRLLPKESKKEQKDNNRLTEW